MHPISCVLSGAVRSELLFGSFFFQAEDGIRDLVRSRGLGDVYKRQVLISERIEPWHKKLLLFGSLRLERLDNEYIDYLNLSLIHI